jgi:hypothetical protein
MEASLGLPGYLQETPGFATPPRDGCAFLVGLCDAMRRHVQHRHSSAIIYAVSESWTDVWRGACAGGSGGCGQGACPTDESCVHRRGLGLTGQQAGPPAGDG